TNGCEGMSNVIDTRSTHIDELFAASISIYPNPTSGILTIQSNTDVHVTVKSIDGRILLTKNNAQTIDIAHLSDGMYFVTINEANGNGVYTQKITKSTH